MSTDPLKDNYRSFKQIVNTFYNEEINSIEGEEDVLKNKVDVFIDDNWEVVNQISKERKIPVFLFKANYNMKYNGSMIEKVDNWKDIYIKIKDIGGYK